jgi:hypothetical protein
VHGVRGNYTRGFSGFTGFTGFRAGFWVLGFGVLGFGVLGFGLRIRQSALTRFGRH